MFELEPSNLNASDQDLLDDLKSVAAHRGTQKLTKADYRATGRYSPMTLHRRFGSWNAALAVAGLAPSRCCGVTADAVVADMRRAAAAIKRISLSQSKYLRLGGFRMPHIYRHFGSWRSALAAAGLAPVSHAGLRYTDQELFENLENVWRTLGRQPRCTQLFRPLSEISLAAYQNRFGGWPAALRAFVQQQKPPANQSSPRKPAPLRQPVQIIHHTTSRHINMGLRFKILRRDRYRCRGCGRSPSGHPQLELHVDHIKPWSGGGETTAENLQTLCSDCNFGKSNLAWKKK